MRGSGAASGVGVGAGRDRSRAGPGAAQRARRRWIVPLALALAALAAGPGAASSPSGPARVIDGDTIDVAGVRVRLYGIDAPERAQTCRAAGRDWRCGRAATRALAGRIGGRPVKCEERDRDDYRRIVAVCRVEGVDLNAWMVRQGWAFAYRRYSRAYVGEEAAARAAGRGIWRGEVMAPWEWRRR